MRKHPSQAWIIWFGCATLGLVFYASGCHASSRDSRSVTDTLSNCDINTVLRAHDNEFMQIPGVVGVYVGLRSDGKTPCLKVMAARITPEIRSKVPQSLEGYPVEIEETGEIRPLNSR
jgi:hypothetical protein